MLSKSDFNANDNDLSRKLVRGGQAAAGMGGKETAGGYMVVSAIMYLLFGFGALTLRLILRKNMGERTFGVLSIILAYFWLKYVYVATFIYSTSCADFKDFDCANPWIKGLMVLVGPLFEMSSWLFGIKYSEFSNANIGRHLGVLSFPNPGEESLLPYFAIAILIIGVVAMVEVFTRKTHIYTYYRGESVFFKALIGKKFGNFTINEITLWMIVEPLAVFLFGILVSKLFGDWRFGFTLQFAAFCLLMEEARAQIKTRILLINLRDAHIENEYVLKTQSSQSTSSLNIDSAGNTQVDDRSGKASSAD